MAQIHGYVLVIWRSLEEMLPIKNMFNFNIANYQMPKVLKF